jgi:hypothetical protein
MRSGLFPGIGNHCRGMLLCGLLLSSPAFAAGALQGVMQALAGVERSEVRYREEKQLAMLDLPLLQTGTLNYVAPDQFSRSLDGPGGGKFSVRGDQVVIEKNSERETHDLNSLPMIKAFVASFGATLAGDLPRLQQHYTVGFSGQLQGWRLLLQPKDPGLAAHVQQIQLWGNGDKIESMEIRETKGDWSRMILLYD